MEKPSALVVIVTRNNPELIKHATDAYLRYDPGHSCEFLVIDNDSDEACQRVVMQCVQKLKAQFYQGRNDRVECSFDLAWAMFRMSSHDCFFFAHDDCVPVQHGWLKAYVDRLHSGYAETDTPEQYKSLPIGRVGTMHHFWRGYSDVKGFAVQCLFLKAFIEHCTPYEVPPMFKYCDVDRVLVTRQCLKATGNLITLNNVSQFEGPDSSMHKVLDAFLPYRDEGTYPADKYPPDEHWSKRTLLSEFLNSVMPLIQGYRTVGLKGDGYLEQIHGSDALWGHTPVAHYGAPNALACLAKVFNASTHQIKQRMNDPIFLLKAHRVFRENSI